MSAKGIENQSVECVSKPAALQGNGLADDAGFFHVYEGSRQNGQSTENGGLQAIQVSHKRDWAGRRVTQFIRALANVADKGASATGNLHSALGLG